MILQEQELFERAREVLGVGLGISENELRYAYYRRMMQYHPDRNPDDPMAHEKTALINEAFRFLSGNRANALLLKDDRLVATVSEGPPREFDDILSYEDWIKARFYDIENRSIYAC